MCLKINIVPHDGKKGNIWKVDAWKHIDLVVYHTRNVYNFFQVIGRFAEATLIKFSLVTLLFGIYRVISLTDLSTGFIKPKITEITNKQIFLKKNYIVFGSLSWTCKFGEAGLAENIDEIMVKILILPYISNLTKLQSKYFFQMNILSWLFIPTSPNSWVHLNRP